MSIKLIYLDILAGETHRLAVSPRSQERALWELESG
jgi:hypothetical protein